MIYTNTEKTQYFMKGKYGDTVSGTNTVNYQTIKLSRLEESTCSARSPGYVLNVMTEKDWQEEYRRSSVKSLYTVSIQSLEQHITFGQ